MLLSATTAVFVTSISGVETIEVKVGSSTVLPSLSIPSSEVSLTDEEVALIAETIKVFETPPELTAS